MKLIPNVNYLLAFRKRNICDQTIIPTTTTTTVIVFSRFSSSLLCLLRYPPHTCYDRRCTSDSKLKQKIHSFYRFHA